MRTARFSVGDQNGNCAYLFVVWHELHDKDDMSDLATNKQLRVVGIKAIKDNKYVAMKVESPEYIYVLDDDKSSILIEPPKPPSKWERVKWSETTESPAPIRRKRKSYI
ncbi:hypothetical protein M3Y98_00684800 [Aphelenchoides besseyi]|nr:hypothetical protein M3Y98_00684800 [Aphelenchoides besseyi]KAI6209052.1 hypothetical protein M3Y96_00180200 [Aphelenchoides besseyi]